MTKFNFKNSYDKFLKKINDFDFNVFQENIKNFQIQDIKNINYSRLIYDFRTSKYTKPFLGVFSAAALTFFVLIPKIESTYLSMQKVRQYKNESKNLNNKIQELKKEQNKFQEINQLYTRVNESFLKSEEIIFIANLIDQAAKKSNITINSFSPVTKSETANLCKVSTSQKNSKQFKQQQKKSSISKKGQLQKKYYEVSFRSDYMDLLQFLKEVQYYDVMLATYCLEVNSEQLVNTLNNDDLEDNSIIISLDQSGAPINSFKEVNKKSNFQNLDKVFTTMILQIPSYSK